MSHPLGVPEPIRKYAEPACAVVMYLGPASAPSHARDFAWVKPSNLFPLSDSVQVRIILVLLLELTACNRCAQFCPCLGARHSIMLRHLVLMVVLVFMGVRGSNRIASLPTTRFRLPSIRLCKRL